MIGATAAAFGLVVTSVGGTTSLFLRYGVFVGLVLVFELIDLGFKVAAFFG